MAGKVNIFMNNVIMLTIAVTKALLVVLFFMHVRWGTRLTWVVAGAASHGPSRGRAR